MWGVWGEWLRLVSWTSLNCKVFVQTLLVTLLCRAVSLEIQNRLFLHSATIFILIHIYRKNSPYCIHSITAHYIFLKGNKLGTNWGTGSSVWTWGRTSSLWGWRSTGTGCPGRLWSLLLWRYSRVTRTRSCAACCRWPCFGRRVGLDDPQRSLPTPTILWFYDSVTCLVLKEFLPLSILCSLSYRDRDTSIMIHEMFYISWDQFFASFFHTAKPVLSTCQDWIPLMSPVFTPGVFIVFSMLMLSGIPVIAYSFFIAIWWIKGFGPLEFSVVCSFIFYCIVCRWK